jgi:hypothetical protein
MRQELAKMGDRMAVKERELDRKTQLSEVKNMLADNKDEFELTLIHNAAPKVLELMDHYFENEKKLLTYTEAARAIETELERYEKQKAELLSKSSKAKEIYKSLIAQGVSKTEAKSVSQAVAQQKDTEEKSSSEASTKPKAVIPATIRKPNVRSVGVGDPGIQEVNSSYQNPRKNNMSKDEALRKVIAKYG